jgi:MFS family permease
MSTAIAPKATPATAASGPVSGGDAPSAARLAVPFLGFLAAVQGACPNIASTALVGASRALHMAGSTQALAASLQTLSIAATAITTGLLADRLGRRRVLMVALVVGALGNVIVLASPTTAVYMLGMIVTGVGLGAVYGTAFGYMTSVVATSKMAAAMGEFVAVTMGATVVLTFVGGTLASSHWRLAYVLIPVMCLASLVVTPLLLPKVPRVTGSSLDLVGQGLLMVGVVAFLYSVSQFAHSLTSPRTLVPLGLGIAALAAFAVWESRFDGNFFPMALFRSPLFLAALCAGFIYNFGTAVSFLQVTNLWQYVNGLKTSQVALWQLPLMLSGIAAGLVVGRRMSKGMSDRAAILLGGASCAIGLVWLAVFHGAAALIGFLPGLILVGAGVAIAAVPFGSLMLAEAPPEHIGPVSSSRLTFGQIFYTVGLATSTVVIDRLTTGGVVHRLEHAGVSANQIGTGIDAVDTFAAQGTAPTTSLGKQALHDAATSYGHAFATMMYLGGAVTLAVGILAFALLSRHSAAPTPDGPNPIRAGLRHVSRATDQKAQDQTCA